MRYQPQLSHPDDIRWKGMSSGWHNGFTVSHPDELAPGRISSGWLLDTAVCHPDDMSYHHMSSGWLSRNWYLIRMSYDNVIMPSGWHTLPFLSHPDEIANFGFPQHAVALQRFRIHRTCCIQSVNNTVTKTLQCHHWWHWSWHKDNPRYTCDDNVCIIANLGMYVSVYWYSIVNHMYLFTLHINFINQWRHWKCRVVMMSSLPSLIASVVVITTSGARVTTKLAS